MRYMAILRITFHTVNCWFRECASSYARAFVRGLPCGHKDRAKVAAYPTPTQRRSKTHYKRVALRATLYLAKGARVICTWNGWKVAGLVNGAQGIVHEILYAEGQGPPSMPIAVLEQFPTLAEGGIYRGPSYLTDSEKKNRENSERRAPERSYLLIWLRTNDNLTIGAR